MKIFKSTPRPNGKVRMIVELEANEEIRSFKEGQSLVLIDPDHYYKLGEPMRDEVFAGHILADAKRTHWCTLEQKWID